MVEYNPMGSKVQNVWSKEWRDKKSKDVLEQRKQMNIDVRDNNRKDDIQEYKYIVEVLGVKNAPISLTQFQELKYNDGEGYERLIDRTFIQHNFTSGKWLDKINPEKQSRHIQTTTGSDKSYFFEEVDLDALYEKYKMTGYLELTRSGNRTSNEKVDIFEKVTVGIDIYTGNAINAMTIKYSRTGVHLIPTYYERRD